jgi:hypothetical protein
MRKVMKTEMRIVGKQEAMLMRTVMRAVMKTVMRTVMRTMLRTMMISTVALRDRWKAGTTLMITVMRTVM